jgi:hypothetical protein
MGSRILTDRLNTVAASVVASTCCACLRQNCMWTWLTCKQGCEPKKVENMIKK